jgi:DNA-binding transcriptional MerR regulator
MLLKIGELAKRTGLTVRTLHHYDSIGLLKPSARSDVGYRLYDRTDIARLHQIQALRRLDMSLSAIGALMAGTGPGLPTIIDQQLRLLGEQIERTERLRGRLGQLRQQLTDGQEPELADWLTTLELMTMYDRYFSTEELQRLALVGTDTDRKSAWAANVTVARAMIDRGVSPSDAEAQILAARWMGMLEEDTDADPRLFHKLNHMFGEEPGIREQTGISAEVTAFIHSAFAESRLALYEKYLSPDEYAFMRTNFPGHSSDWPELIASVRQHMDHGVSPEDPEVRALAERWFTMFRRYAGDDPATWMKIRLAHEKEPGLLKSAWIDEAMITFIGKAIGRDRTPS